jgi:hypothetical protein
LSRSIEKSALGALGFTILPLKHYQSSNSFETSLALLIEIFFGINESNLACILV